MCRGGFFSGSQTAYFSAAKWIFVTRERFGLFPFLTFPKASNTFDEQLAEVVSYRDVSGISTSWTRRGRFGGRLTTRTRRETSAKLLSLNSSMANIHDALGGTMVSGSCYFSTASSPLIHSPSPQTSLHTLEPPPCYATPAYSRTTSMILVLLPSGYAECTRTYIHRGLTPKQT